MAGPGIPLRCHIFVERCCASGQRTNESLEQHSDGTASLVESLFAYRLLATFMYFRAGTRQVILNLIPMLLRDSKHERARSLAFLLV